MEADIITRFIDDEGRITVWPSKSRHKEIVISYLAGKFQKGHPYIEKEVNEVIKQWHTFTDWPLLRRELVDRGYLNRDRGGYEYRLTDKSVDE